MRIDAHAVNAKAVRAVEGRELGKEQCDDRMTVHELSALVGLAHLLSDRLKNFNQRMCNAR